MSSVVPDVSWALLVEVSHLGVRVVVNLISFVSSDVFLTVVPVVVWVVMWLLVLMIVRASCWPASWSTAADFFRL